MGKLLRVNMATLQCSYESMSDDLSGLGGRGITSHLVAREVPPLCDPLGSENKLVLAPGILSGTSCPNSGRISIGAKSPLTGTIKESNAGGGSSAKIARIGLSTVVIEGKPENGHLYILELKKDSAKLIPSDNLKGLGTYQLASEINKNYDKKPAILCIGPAGEHLMTSASIQVTDTSGRPCRAAGRGGLGSVMGSKGIKAIAVDDAGGETPDIADPELFKSGQRKASAAILRHPVTSQAMPAFGTAMLVAPINAVGAFPTMNARSGTFDKWEMISGEKMAELIHSRGGQTGHSGCTNCIIKCSNIYVDENKQYLTSSLEYETIWALGGMCGISDLDAIAKFDYMCDDTGLDTMNTGCALAVAMEAKVKEFGDAEGALSLVEEIRKGSEIGRLIGNGPAAVGEHYGISRVPVVKRQSVAAYDPRAIQGIGVTYSTSPMGADHTAGWTVAENLEAMGGRGNALVADEQVEISRNTQISTAANDATGLCQFTGFPLSADPEGAEGFMELLSARLGRKFGQEDFIEMGKKILRTEREFNLAAGFTAKDDRLPEFYYKEPLPPHNKTFLVADSDIDTLFDF